MKTKTIRVKNELVEKLIQCAELQKELVGSKNILFSESDMLNFILEKYLDVEFQELKQLLEYKNKNK